MRSNDRKKKIEITCVGCRGTQNNLDISVVYFFTEHRKNKANSARSKNK